eukprot:2565130-Prymnesium_polylepis.1
MPRTVGATRPESKRSTTRARRPSMSPVKYIGREGGVCLTHGTLARVAAVEGPVATRRRSTQMEFVGV